MFSNNGIGRIVYAMALGIMMVSLPLAPQLLGNENSADQNHEPANKTSVASSNLEVFGSGEVVPLLSTVMKTSKPTDLVISVTLECSILTELTTIGTDVESARAAIKVWVEIDGMPVLINPEEGVEDDGKVVFCDRLHKKETTFVEDEEATIKDHLDTRSANAFNWIHMDAGSATHSIVVKAEFVENTGPGDGGVAEATVGKRTLVVEPFKFSNDETFMSE